MTITELDSESGDASRSTKSLIRRMLGLVWAYRWGCLKIVALQSALLSLGMLGLGLTGIGVDTIRFHMATVGHSTKPPRWPFGLAPPDTWAPITVLAYVALALLAFAAFRSVLNAFYTISVNHLLQGRIVVDLRSRVYKKLQRLSFRFFDANASGAIINRVTGDVQAVRSFVDGVVVQLLILTLSLTIYLVYMARIHGWLTLACLATTPLMWFTTARFSRRVRPAYNQNRDLFDDQIRVLSENVQGTQVVKGFARQREEIGKFEHASNEVRDKKHWIFGQVSIFQPLIGFLSQINLIVLIGFGGYLVVCYEKAPDAVTAAAVGLSVGQLLVFAGLLQQFSGQVANVAGIADSMQQSLIGAQRVFEILDAPVEIENDPSTAPLTQVGGCVEFRNVTFGYKPNVAVLHDISFSVKPGQCVAILGATGAGKSTLLSLSPRFYDVESGSVRIDDRDVKTLPLDDLRRNIGMVFQESFLFSNTVRANIAFGHPEATQQEIERAASIAAAHGFIQELPDGYDTLLREGGSNLSGGQRQRLAIARALLLDPAILLMDDPTAAIDPQTESEIMQAMTNAMQGRTTFLVAHRLSTLRRAELVIVLDKGRVVEIGTHDELMQLTGHYRHAAALQIPDRQSLRLLGEPEDLAL